jgi:membrane associated rhomboid family serine protease
MWLINVFQFILQLDFGSLGIHPRDKTTLIGILTSPLIHGNWQHLFANTLPVLILGLVLFLTYEKFAVKVWLLIYLFTGLLVWLFARGTSYHIGASGIIYGLASFLLFSGFFRMDIKSIAIACGVSVFYGGMVWGIFPLENGVSWESHLFGGISGLMLAYLYRNTDKDSIIQQHESEITERKTFNDFINQ